MHRRTTAGSRSVEHEESPQVPLSDGEPDAPASSAFLVPSSCRMVTPCIQYPTVTCMVVRFVCMFPKSRANWFSLVPRSQVQRTLIVQVVVPRGWGLFGVRLQAGRGGLALWIGTRLCIVLSLSLWGAGCVGGDRAMQGSSHCLRILSGNLLSNDTVVAAGSWLDLKWFLTSSFEFWEK